MQSTHLQPLGWADYQSFIRILVHNSTDWADAPENQGRVNHFAKYLTSGHSQIQEQAYLLDYYLSMANHYPRVMHDGVD